MRPIDMNITVINSSNERTEGQNNLQIKQINKGPHSQDSCVWQCESHNKKADPNFATNKYCNIHMAT